VVLLLLLFENEGNKGQIFDSFSLTETTMANKPGLGNCFKAAGLIKMLESFSIFTCLMLHRIGAKGTQV
jgi:hypothetical protein